ncbi:transposase [Bacillus sp. UMB0893]|uniref:transposase n=1 Tax=Bacillus sp. UMB0893 TaxID=2066053 RepID=UPI001C60CBBA|nr:transposase [Bacillus sp. UMB0893]
MITSVILIPLKRKQISPVAWQHINFYGRYEFDIQQESVDMDAIIQELAQLNVISDTE